MALVAWTALVWGNRVLNVVRGDEEVTARAVSSITAVAFLALAVAGAVVAARTRHRSLDRPAALVVGALAGLTVLYWPLRMVVLALAGHSFGFVAVHLALGVVAAVLAVPVLRAAAAVWPRQPVAG